MKKVFFTIVLAAISSLIFANVPHDNAVESKSIVLTKSFSKVSVGENLNVEFFNATGGSVKLEGNNSFVNGVSLQVINGTLFISLKGDAKFYKGTVKLPVGNLSEININSDSKISSHEFLKCSNLTVYIADGVHAE